ncbi:MAG: DUF5916 domain-containing protein [Croceivirga sp.]
MPKVHIFTRILLSLVTCALIAQDDFEIVQAKGTITVDGIMNEPDWSVAAVATDFQQYFPSDSILAKVQTEVRMTYDKNQLYIIAKMYNLGEREYVTPSLRRDFRGEANDVFTVVLDTYADRNNAFLFGVNPFGVQREGLIANGGSVANDNTFSTGWDNVWYSAARRFDGFWMVEMAIPFKTLRYKKGSPFWYVNFYRFDSTYAEQSTWSPIPQNQFIINLAFSKKLYWKRPLDESQSNLSFIPYSTFRNTKDFIADTPTDHEFNLGADAKVGIGPALTLDLTVNPDFSQVEVDQQVTNLDRFEIFFPERRQFFLENADLFGNYGLEGTRPFFSRRIGVTVDPVTGQNSQSTIYGGLRLNGKLNQKLRVGLLNAQLEQNEASSVPSTNFLVMAAEHRLLSRSYLSAFFINKQAFSDDIDGRFTLSPSVYNRTMGVDVNLASNDNIWNGKFFYHRSFDEVERNSEFATGGFLNYNTYRWQTGVTALSIGRGFNPEVGFRRRRNVFQATPLELLNLKPKSGRLQSYGPGISGDWSMETMNFSKLDRNSGVGYSMNLRNTALFKFSAKRQYTFLLDPFEPSGLNGRPLE